jgi:hypothetical protein
MPPTAASGHRACASTPVRQQAPPGPDRAWAATAGRPSAAWPSNEKTPASAGASMKRTTGFEPATFGLGNDRGGRVRAICRGFSLAWLGLLGSDLRSRGHVWGHGRVVDARCSRFARSNTIARASSRWPSRSPSRPRCSTSHPPGNVDRVNWKDVLPRVPAWHERPSGLLVPTNEIGRLSTGRPPTLTYPGPTSSSSAGPRRPSSSSAPTRTRRRSSTRSPRRRIWPTPLVT